MKQLKPMAAAIGVFMALSAQAKTDLSQIFYPTDDQAHIEQAYQLMVKKAQKQALKQDLALEDPVSQMAGNLNSSQVITPEQFTAYKEALAAHRQQIETLNRDIKALEQVLAQDVVTESAYTNMRHTICQASLDDAQAKLGDESDPTSRIAQLHAIDAQITDLLNKKQAYELGSSERAEISSQIRELDRQKSFWTLVYVGNKEEAQECLAQ